MIEPRATPNCARDGSAPAINLTVSPYTNRITTAGFAYDAAGNLTQSPSGASSDAFYYDSENRLSQANFASTGHLSYRYGMNGERLFDGNNWHFYGPDGTHLGTVLMTTYYNNSQPFPDYFIDELHFAGRLVWQNSFPVVTDRTGSVVRMSSIQGADNYAYYPFGKAVANMAQAWQSYPPWCNTPGCSGPVSGYLDVAFNPGKSGSR